MTEPFNFVFIFHFLTKNASVLQFLSPDIDGITAITLFYFTKTKNDCCEISKKVMRRFLLPELKRGARLIATSYRFLQNPMSPQRDFSVSCAMQAGHPSGK